MKAGAIPAVPGYDFLGIKGKGPGSVVYWAVRVSSRADVAVKLIDLPAELDPGFREQLPENLRRLAGVGHRGIMTVDDIGLTNEGRLYLTMPAVREQSLTGLLRPGGMEPARAWDLFSVVAEALDAAHRQGLVHGNLKPSNVLVSASGEAQLSDFELLLPRVGRLDLSAPASFARHRLWIAPEQLEGQAPTVRSDVFGLAAMIFQMLTGRYPLELVSDAGGNPRIEARVEPPPESPLPAGLWEVLAGAMAADPARRPGSTLDLLDRLAEVPAGRNAAVGGASEARPAAAPQPPREEGPAASSPSGRPDGADPAVGGGEGDDPKVLPLPRGPHRAGDLRPGAVMLSMPGIGGAGQAALAMATPAPEALPPGPVEVPESEPAAETSTAALPPGAAGPPPAPPEEAAAGSKPAEPGGLRALRIPPDFVTGGAAGEAAALAAAARAAAARVSPGQTPTGLESGSGSGLEPAAATEVRRPSWTQSADAVPSAPVTPAGSWRAPAPESAGSPPAPVRPGRPDSMLGSAAGPGAGPGPAEIQPASAPAESFPEPAVTADAALAAGPVDRVRAAEPASPPATSGGTQPVHRANTAIAFLELMGMPRLISSGQPVLNSFGSNLFRTARETAGKRWPAVVAAGGLAAYGLDGPPDGRQREVPSRLFRDLIAGFDGAFGADSGFWQKHWGQLSIVSWLKISQEKPVRLLGRRSGKLEDTLYSFTSSMDRVRGERLHAFRKVDSTQFWLVLYDNLAASGRSSQQPVCHFWEGGLDALLRWAGVANDWVIDELECGAVTGTGDCVFSLRSLRR